MYLSICIYMYIYTRVQNGLLRELLRDCEVAVEILVIRPSLADSDATTCACMNVTGMVCM